MANVKELKKKAQALGIPGYHGMLKAQLEQAIDQAENPELELVTITADDVGEMPAEILERPADSEPGEQVGPADLEPVVEFVGEKAVQQAAIERKKAEQPADGERVQVKNVGSGDVVVAFWNLAPKQVRECPFYYARKVAAEHPTAALAWRRDSSEPWTGIAV